MLNVNQITAQLARMPDPALQQYAQLHKGDPYVLSLALAESNRRKQLRQGAQMNAPQQPKVVDQEIQAMAAPMPENVGIGQLPAGNMNFADGGIVAFADGGVPRYQAGGALSSYDLVRLSQINPSLASAASKGQRLSEALRALRIAGPLGATVGTTLGGGADAALVANSIMADMSPEQREGFYASPMLGAMSGDTGLAGAIMNAAEPPPKGKEYTPEKYGVTKPAPLYPGARNYDVPTTATAVPAPAAAAETAPKADTAAGSKAAADKSMYSLSTAGAGFAPGQGLGFASTPSTLSREFESFMPEGPRADPFAKQTEELGQAGIKAATDYKEAREKQLNELGLFGLDQEKRLNERQAKLSKQEGDVGPLALLQAGFAMMAGTSPYAMQNIGIGAQAGLKSYTEGTDKLEAAREKLDDAFGRLEATRRSEKMLTDKERAELGRDVSKSVIEARRLALAGAKEAYGWEREKAKTLFEAYTKERLTAAELGSRERLGLAQIQAQKDIAAQRTQLMQDLYGGETKARQEFGKIQQAVMKELSGNTAYTMEQNPAKKQLMYDQAIQRALQANPFLASYSAGIGFTKAPAPGKVLDLTE
jgi:hypothetical protein